MRWPMLTLQGTTYYYKRAVPLALRPLMGGRSQIWKSLRTSDKEEAKLLSLRVGQEVERLFESLRRKAAAPADPETVARTHAQRLLTKDARARVTHPMDDNALEAELFALTETLEDHHDALTRNDTRLVSKLLDEVLLEQGLHVPAGQRATFAHALLRSRFDALKVILQRNQGNWTPTEATGPTVTELLEAYLTERKLNSKSEAETRAAYRRLVSVVGNKLARDVSKVDIRGYRASLFAAPSNRSLSADGKLSPTSVKKLLGICATVFRFGIGQGY